MSVNIGVKADFSKTTNMLKRFSTKAIPEYAKAVGKTAAYGERILKETSPVVTGRLHNAWRIKVISKLAAGISGITKGKKAGGVVSNVNYLSHVNDNKRRTPRGAWARRIAKSKKILRSKTDGYKFVDKAVVKIQAYLNKEIIKANQRILR